MSSGLPPVIVLEENQNWWRRCTLLHAPTSARLSKTAPALHVKKILGNEGQLSTELYIFTYMRIPVHTIYHTVHYLPALSAMIIIYFIIHFVIDLELHVY